MVAPYNPIGALNGLFAPAYVGSNPQSVAATNAWNANRQAQINPQASPPTTSPATTPPGGTPGMPGAGGFPFQPGGFNQLQERFAANNTTGFSPEAFRGYFKPLTSRFPPGMFPQGQNQGGSFTFTEPTIAPQSQSQSQPQPSFRDNITKALMQRRGYGV